RGIVFAPDSRWFVAAASDLLARQFHHAAWTRPAAVFYVLLPLLIAAAKAIAPSSWPLLIVAVNAAATACARVLTFRLARTSMGIPGAAVAAAGFVAGAEILDWSRYILSDSLYLGLSTLVLYLMTLALLRNERRFAYAAGGALLVAFVTRPTA